jgi:hypothetical protein
MHGVLSYSSEEVTHQSIECTVHKPVIECSRY